MSRPGLLPPILLIAALAALLLFAATAAAETKVGEATSPVNGALLAEADILKATASYDSTLGTVVFDVTTREAPTANPELILVGGLFSLTGSCNQASIEAAKATLYPAALVVAPYATPLGSPEAVLLAAESEKELSEPKAEPASRTMNGVTTELAATNPKTAGKPYACAAIEVQESGKTVEYVTFPIAVPPSPPAQTTTPVATAPSVPKPAAAALSLARPQPLSAKAGKWTKVKLKVTYTGGTPAGPLQVKAKAPKGVIVKPGTTKLPALLPGQSWTVVLEVELTAKAKKRSTISLTGTLPGLTATSSVVIRSAG